MGGAGAQGRPRRRRVAGRQYAERLHREEREPDRPRNDGFRRHVRRQQAVIDYVLNNLKTAGILSDVGKLSSLLSSAKQYAQFPRDWNIVQFGGEIGGLTPSNIKAHDAAHYRVPDRLQRRRGSVHGQHPRDPADRAASILDPSAGRHSQAGRFRQGQRLRQERDLVRGESARHVGPGGAAQG